ncbi:MAG: fused MFS/spermidine synthase [Gammaproteobacteria bacterium]
MATAPSPDSDFGVAADLHSRDGDDVARADVAAAAAERMPQKWWFYLIFTASGFAALIYESLWARYLKIFLGHAAYAQALVLVIFLFGIAAGSLLAARHSRRLSSPLVVYAAAEALLAVIAVYFHDIFLVAQAWALQDVLPNLHGDFSAQLFKWTLGASLILAQAVLLGATFPLLAAGVVRRWPARPGGTIAALYFVNSAGAAAGVLTGGFWLVPAGGLVGAGLAGGAINAVIAAVVWYLSRRFGEAPPPAEESPSPSAAATTAKILLLTAAITGMSSFIYEVVWTRLISLLLGGSVYSFEIMLAVFIFGLAAGGLLVRRRADRVAEPIALLAKVQIAMGVMALVSLIAYPQAFKFYAYLWEDLPRGESAHIYHWLLGGLMAAALILPTAVCAGMTLPLLTRRLMRDRGEASLGVIYAANTLGAIVGVYWTVHWLLPETGARNAMIIGAMCDLLLGCALFAYLRRRRLSAFATMTTIAATAAALLLGDIPARYAAAGIYRQGKALEEHNEVVFYRDGKTASVAVLKSPAPNAPEYTLSIRTNGKSDASLAYGGASYTGDEMTMTIAALLALLAHPEARLAANIGFGSGLTSRALLQSPHLRRLDNIEIEPLMAEGARRLGDKITPVFSDPRNNFIFDDAKSVFARASARYDVIISEPSNPWISGIGGLFTREFYRQAKESLADDGVFIQWMPFYENSPQIFASVAAALGEEFGDYRMYLSGLGDAVLIAAKETIPPFSDAVFADDGARAFFAAYDYFDAAAMETIFVGDKAHLAPYFASFTAPVNSDYFPYLEHEAPRAFFRRTFFAWANTPGLPVPFMEMAGARPPPLTGARAPMRRSPPSLRAAATQALLADINLPDGELREKIAALQKISCLAADDRIAESYMLSVSDLSALLLPYAAAAQTAEVWEILAAEPCVAAMLDEEADELPARYTRFWRALSLRDAPAILKSADALVASGHIDVGAESGQIVLLALMAAHYQLANYDQVVGLLTQIPPRYPAVHHAGRFLGALAAEKI